MKTELTNICKEKSSRFVASLFPSSIDHQCQQLASDIAGIGFCQLQYSENHLIYDQKLLDILHLSEYNSQNGLSDFFNLLHMDDAGFVKEAIDNAIISGQLTIECRLVNDSNIQRWLAVKGTVYNSEDTSKPVLLLACRDITQEKNSVETIAALTKKLSLATSSGKIGLWDILLPDFEIHWDESMYQLFGLASNKAQPLFAVWLKSIHEEDVEAQKNIIENAIAEKTNFESEFRIVRPDNSIRYLKSYGFLRHNTKGDVCGVLGAYLDITDQKNAEQELSRLNQNLEKRAEELIASNNELERFAYIASHDLQEPLRMVSSFMHLLTDQYGDTLDSAAKEYIHYAVDGAERMKRLIMDLLEYSRVGTNKDKYEQVDINQVLKNIEQVFEPELSETKGQIIYGELPVIKGIATQIEQLFQNLISNALKYHGSLPPKIYITYKEDEQYWTFFVKDNGIGINAKFFEKIFVIFQRLHSNSKYSGTGIGLAVCKKIVDRHKGSIWVESEPNIGSIFYFTVYKYL